MEDDFDHCLPMGNRDLDQDNAETIFFSFSQGLKTSGDAWAYNFDRRQLATNMTRTITTYNEQVSRWSNQHPKPDLDDFVLKDETQIRWSSSLKNFLRQGIVASFQEDDIKEALYRPYSRPHVYFRKP